MSGSRQPGPALPFQIVGDDEAPVCIEGVCSVPGTAQEGALSSDDGAADAQGAEQV